MGNKLCKKLFKNFKVLFRDIQATQLQRCTRNYKIFRIVILKKNSNDKTYSKFNISATLDLKIKKSPLRNPSPKLFWFDFLNFELQNYSLSNNCYTRTSFNMMKKPWGTHTNSDFQPLPRMNCIGAAIWEIST